MEITTERKEFGISGRRLTSLVLGVGLLTGTVYFSGRETPKKSPDKPIINIYRQMIGCVDKDTTGFNINELAEFIDRTGINYNIRLFEGDSSKITVRVETPTRAQLEYALKDCEFEAQMEEGNEHNGTIRANYLTQSNP